MTQKRQSFIRQLTSVLTGMAKEVLKPENITPMVAVAIQMKAVNFLIDSAVNKGKKYISKEDEASVVDIEAVPARKKRV